MELKSKHIKSMNDCIGGVVLMAASVFLLVSKNITEGRIVTGQGGFFVRADTYIRMLGVLMFFLAFLMVIRSINFKKIAETKGFSFAVTKESLCTVAALIVFLLLLKPLGFAITTFLFSFFVVCLYMRKEHRDKGLNRRDWFKKTAFAGVFSLILVVVVYLVFAKLLLVTLP